MSIPKIVTKDKTVSTSTAITHLVGRGSSPTLSSSLSGILTGDDLGGSITLMTSGSNVSGTLAQVTFVTSYTTTPFVFITDVNDNFSAGITNPVKISSSMSGFTMSVKTGMALEINEIYKWNYLVKQ